MIPIANKFNYIYNKYIKSTLYLIVKKIVYILFVAIVAISMPTLTTSCVKENVYLEDNNARLNFSCDTLKFDTVFVTMGTTTQRVTVHNPYNKTILLNQVTLAEGSNSRFRLNIDGDTNMVVRNLEIAAKDSIFIFVQANINPNASTEPFLIEDAINFQFGQVEQKIVLTAYGRNAIYHIPTDTIVNEIELANGNIIKIDYPYSVINCDEWDHSRPHVIVNYAVVDSDKKLILESGDELYFGDQGCLWVYDGGTLVVNGTKEQPVLFTSVRHDGWYDSLPGQWQQIWLSSGSRDNIINYAQIENNIFGVVVDTNVNNNPTLTITNSKILHASQCGILGQGAYIMGENLLITNCQEALVALQYGGKYYFRNSTFANHWEYGGRKFKSIILNNWYTSANGDPIIRDLEAAHFYNCIIDGSFSANNGGEVALERNPNGAFNILFDHCIVKSNDVAEYSENTQFDIDPKFIDIHLSDFHLKEDSPAIGAGTSSQITIPYDLDGAPRNNPPSIGAYEYIE